MYLVEIEIVLKRLIIRKGFKTNDYLTDFSDIEKNR